MTRLSAAFWVILVVVAGFTTFRVKYAVQDIEDQLARVKKQTAVEQQEIRVLTAEWTYLTQPERLADLNKKFLGLASVNARQLQRGIEQIPLRPPPVPPPEALLETKVEPTPPTAAPAAAPASTPALAAAEAMPADQIVAEMPPPRAARVQLAKIDAATPSGSLDALIAQIVDTH